MNSRELRKIFLDFFEKKGHKIMPSSSLIPSDPSVLFTTAGMQQFTLYLQGEKDPVKDFGARHLASCQKCFRSDDIDDVGDDTHNTFFEMLGNWSIGEDLQRGYFKEGAIKYALEFLVGELGLDKTKFWLTVFKGDKNIPKDSETIKIWRKNGIPADRLKEFGMKDNFWGPVGNKGPCGPNSEIHYDRGEEFGCGKPDCGPNCLRCQRVVEIWNLVFMEYDKNDEYVLLPQKNVDTGIGFERLLAVLQKKPSAYETDLFIPIIQELEKLSSRRYEEEKRAFRIIADHIRGAVFLISEGILPFNLGQGYVLRRLLRRAIRYGKLLTPHHFENKGGGGLIPLAQKAIEIYKDIYPEVKSKETDILTVIQNEEEKFEKTIERGLKELKCQMSLYRKRKFSRNLNIKCQNLKVLSGKVVFNLYQSYGFPLELTKELAEENAFKVDEDGFKEAFKRHQEISRAGAEKKFGGIGKEATYESAKLHTATHLLHSALRKILGVNVKQMGSDITPQRLRFDFSHPQKMAPEEIKKTENLVNQKIKDGLEVKKEELGYEEAIKSGALAFFKEKYPEKVTVYTVGIFSKEICVGPHAKRTSELGHFKIVKEESSGAGVRRIKAILQ